MRFRTLLLVWALLVGCSQAAAAPKRNIILFIGDGMGPQQLGLLYLANHYRQTNPEQSPGALSRVMNEGRIALVQPIPHQALVIDSACSATELASGKDTLPEALGVDALGENVTTALEIAASRGKSTGLVSDTRITHATPAAFFANVTHRSQENEIAEQLIDGSVTVALSGGLRHFVPKDMRFASDIPFRFSSKRTDSRDLLAEASRKGFTVVHSKDTLAAATGPKVLGLFADASMEDAFQSARGESSQPSLEEMTRNSLRLLAQDQEGFFLMVEAGQVDWAGHANDAGWLLKEMGRADRALQVVLEWMRARNDTLLLVTADHETGGFSFSYHAANVPLPRPFPGSLYPGALFAPQYDFVAPSVLGRLASQRGTLWEVANRWLKRASSERTPKQLVATVYEATGVRISESSAKRILTQAPNPLFRERHKDLEVREWTDLCAYSAFHPNPINRMTTAIARELAPELGVVWSTGTHTSTPVMAAWLGDDRFSPSPRGMLTMTELGQALVSYISEASGAGR